MRPSVNLRLSARPPTSRTHQWRDYEVEVVDGLEDFAEQELEAELGASVAVVGRAAAGRVSVRYRGDPRRFFSLRSILARHGVMHFHVARPRALLGHEHLEALLDVMREVTGLHPDGAFATFRVTAAGSGSPVFTRLKEHIGAALGLSHSRGPAHLHVAVHRTAPLAGRFSCASLPGR